MVLLWRGGAASGIFESTSQRIWLGLHTLTLWWRRRSSPSTTSGSWGSYESPGVFFRPSAVESILTGNSSSQDGSADDGAFMKAPHHPNNSLLKLLRSGKCFQSHPVRTVRFYSYSFIIPQAIRTVNSDLAQAATLPTHIIHFLYYPVVDMPTWLYYIPIISPTKPLLLL